MLCPEKSPNLSQPITPVGPFCSQELWDSFVTRFMNRYSITDEHIFKALSNGEIALSERLLFGHQQQHLTSGLASSVAGAAESFFTEHKQLLHGCHCAYLCCIDAHDLVSKVNALLNLGVRNFSIQSSNLHPSPLELFRMLVSATKHIEDCIAFTFWIDFHVNSIVETLKYCESQTVAEISSKRVLTIGLLLPSLFLSRAAQGQKWKMFDLTNNEKASQLYLQHAENYENAYKMCDGKAFTYDHESLLTLIVHCSISSNAKILVYNRDVCYTESKGHFLRKDTEANTCFPNHVGEVPMEINGSEIVVTFSAFLNLEKMSLNEEKLSFFTQTAYNMLTAVSNNVIKNYKTHEILEHCVLKPAVGLVGLCESLKRPVTLWDVEKLSLITHKLPTRIFPMSGIVAASVWNVSEGIWNCLVPYRNTLTNFILSRRFVDWLRDQFFAKKLPQDFYNIVCKNNIVNISATDSNFRDNLEKYAVEFMSSEMCDHKQRSLSTNIHFQMELLRKICNSFFSPTSMQLVFTHDDCAIFPERKNLEAVLIDLLMTNFFNNCVVLLPEIRNSTQSTKMLMKMKKLPSVQWKSALKGFYDAISLWDTYDSTLSKYSKLVIKELLRKHVEHSHT